MQIAALLHVPYRPEIWAVRTHLRKASADHQRPSGIALKGTHLHSQLDIQVQPLTYITGVISRQDYRKKAVWQLRKLTKLPDEPRNLTPRA